MQKFDSAILESQAFNIDRRIFVCPRDIGTHAAEANLILPRRITSSLRRQPMGSGPWVVRALGGCFFSAVTISGSAKTCQRYTSPIVCRVSYQRSYVEPTSTSFYLLYFSVGYLDLTAPLTSSFRQPLRCPRGLPNVHSFSTSPDTGSQWPGYLVNVLAIVTAYFQNFISGQ